MSSHSVVTDDFKSHVLKAFPSFEAAYDYCLIGHDLREIERVGSGMFEVATWRETADCIYILEPIEFKTREDAARCALEAADLLAIFELDQSYSNTRKLNQQSLQDELIALIDRYGSTTGDTAFPNV